MRPSAFVLTAAIVLPSLALAQVEPGTPPVARDAWVLTATNSDGDAHFVTPYRIRQTSEDRLTVWVKRVYGKLNGTGGEALGAGDYSYSLSQYEYDCAAKSSALLRELHYRAGGVEVARRTGNAVHQPARPDSLDEASLLAVCRAATAISGR